MKNDYQIERLLNEFKEYESEYKRLTNISKKMIEDYQEKINEYQEKISIKEKSIKEQIFSLIEIDKMKDTKTLYSHKMPSGKITITKDTYSIKQNSDLIGSIPQNYIEIQKKIKWGEYKKKLIISGDNIVNIETGEIVDKGVSIEKKNGGELNIKLGG
jgi:hypothetical protein